jgi:hypothetical protein
LSRSEVAGQIGELFRAHEGYRKEFGSLFALDQRRPKTSVPQITPRRNIRFFGGVAAS